MGKDAVYIDNPLSKYCLIINKSFDANRNPTKQRKIVLTRKNFIAVCKLKNRPTVHALGTGLEAHCRFFKNFSTITNNIKNPALAALIKPERLGVMVTELKLDHLAIAQAIVGVIEKPSINSHLRRHINALTVGEQDIELIGESIFNQFNLDSKEAEDKFNEFVEKLKPKIPFNPMKTVSIFDDVLWSRLLESLYIKLHASERLKRLPVNGARS